MTSSCLIDGVVVVVPVQEDVEAEREGEDEQGIPAKEEGWLFLHQQARVSQQIAQFPPLLCFLKV